MAGLAPKQNDYKNKIKQFSILLHSRAREKKTQQEVRILNIDE